MLAINSNLTETNKNLAAEGAAPSVHQAFPAPSAFSGEDAAATGTASEGEKTPSEHNEEAEEAKNLGAEAEGEPEGDQPHNDEPVDIRTDLSRSQRIQRHQQMMQQELEDLGEDQA